MIGRTLFLRIGNKPLSITYICFSDFALRIAQNRLNNYECIKKTGQ